MDKCADFINALHSIISPLCLVWVKAPHWARETLLSSACQYAMCLFSGVFPFSSNLLIGPSHRDIKLNKKRIYDNSPTDNWPTCQLTDSKYSPTTNSPTRLLTDRTSHRQRMRKFADTLRQSPTLIDRECHKKR